MNNIQGYSLSKPSTKTTQAPGGNSSITFGDQGGEPAQVKRNVRNPNASQFTLGGDPVPQQQQQQPQQQQQQQNVQNQQEGSKFKFTLGVHTSVKVKNPPGGRSNITFG